MITLANIKDDKTYLFIAGDDADLKRIEAHFNKIPAYQFMPSFRGIPRAEIFMHRGTKNGKQFLMSSAGLWREVITFCESQKINVDNRLCESFSHRDMVPLDEFIKIIHSWNLNLEARDYQIVAAWKILNFHQSLSLIATRGGKTFIFYIITRFMREYYGAKKILMVVPNIYLVKQGVQDLNEYGEFFTSEAVWARGEHVEQADMTIGTYQSLVKKLTRTSKRYNPHFFDDFDVVCIDEAHHLACDSIEMILQQPFIKNCKLRFGFTGTLPKDNTIERICCHALMGPKIQDIRTNELVEQGFICNANVTQLMLQYEQCDALDDLYVRCGEYLCANYDVDVNKNKIKLPKNECAFTMIHKKTLPFSVTQYKKQASRREYIDYLIDLCKAEGSKLLNLEQMIVQFTPQRIDVMCDVINNERGNGIIFAHHKEYVKYIADCMKHRFPNRNVYVIQGSVTLKQREKIINAMLNDDSAILCAAYSVLSTGVTLKNINYGIFAESFKSDIINKQSIGRGLLKQENKEFFYIYDLIDVLPTKRIEAHGREKAKTFKDEKFIYQSRNVPLDFNQRLI